RPNRTWLIRDDSSNLEVLEYHNNLQITETPENNYYNLLTVEGCDIDIDQKTYVPILPGYSIITNIGGSYIRFTIKKNEQNLLYFAWYDYGNDSTLTSEEHSYSGTHFFNTFNDYIQKKRKGKWSTPNLLGLNIKENVEFLRNKICHHYPSIFNDCKQIQTATKKTNTLINAMKRKGDQLIKEIESGVENDNNINENQTNIKEGIIIKSKGINVTPTEAQAALVKFRERDLKIKELATQAINSSQVGSTIMVDTCNYVSPLLSQSCHNCGDISIDNKNCVINNVGFSVNTIICCGCCNNISEFSNDTPKATQATIKSLKENNKNILP
ncbi:7265_t:CDS:2, partial [Entrophospora sp. SA101]